MFFFCKNKSMKYLLPLAAAVCCGVLPLHAKVYTGLDSGSDGGEDLPKISNLAREDIDMSADSYEYVGANLIARGHAVIKVKSLQITADAVTVNLLTKDLEAAGNVVFSVQSVSSRTVTPAEYEKLMENPAMKVIATGITTQRDGNQSIEVMLIRNSAYLSAERASGNLDGDRQL